MPRIFVGETRHYVYDAMYAVGASVEDAGVVAEPLLAENQGGAGSYGMVRIAQYVETIRSSKLQRGVLPRLLSETETKVVINGCQGLVQVVGKAVVAATSVGVDPEWDQPPHRNGASEKNP